MFSAGTLESSNGNLSISEMNNGTYRVSLLTNISSKSNWAAYIADLSSVTIDVNGVAHNPVKIEDNTDALTVFENVVVENGVLSIKIDISQTNKRCMLNVIEIEKIN